MSCFTISPVAVIPLGRDMPPIPTKNGVRRDYGGQLKQCLAAKCLALDRQPPPLIVGEQDALLPSLRLVADHNLLHDREEQFGRVL